jgi:hypothetical protein
MPYGFLADVVLLLHGAFVVFVVAGGLLVLRWLRVAWVHVPTALWGAVIEFAGFICPLTPLENAWRRAAGGEAYQGGFIEHYVTAVLYPSGLTRPIQIALGMLVLGINASVYWKLWRRRAVARAAA